MMRPTSACTAARCSAPRGLDSIAAERSASLTFLLPSKATRPSTGCFGHTHDKALTAAINCDLFEQAGCDQRLQCRIARGYRRSARQVQRENKIEPFGIDAAIAFDHDYFSRRLHSFCRPLKPSEAIRSGRPATSFQRTVEATAFVA